MSENTTMNPELKKTLQTFINANASGRSRTLEKLLAVREKDENERFAVMNEAVLAFVRKEVMSSEEPVTILYGENLSLTFSDRDTKGLVPKTISVMPITKAIMPYFEVVIATLSTVKLGGVAEMPKAHEKAVNDFYNEPRTWSKKCSKEMYSLILLLDTRDLTDWKAAIHDEYAADTAGILGMRVLSEAYKLDMCKERVRASEKPLVTKFILKEVCSWVNLGKEDRQSLLDRLEDYE